MADNGKKKEIFHPGSNLDPELQRELDEALEGMSLEDVLAAEEEKERTPAGAGKGVKRGVVAGIQGDFIFVDMGGKSQGLLPATQYGDDEPLPAVGDSIEVTIQGYDRAEGLLMLSRKGAILAATWENLSEGQVVEARVTDHNKGGLELSIQGIRAFMPISQIEMFRIDDLAPYVGRTLQCQVTELSEEDDRVIVSRRAILEIEAEQAREKAWQEIAEGQIVSGVVRSIMPYGAFVDIGGLDGLLHVGDMSFARVEDPQTIVTEGQKIQVKVLKVDREARRISLGLKQTMPDPWSMAPTKYHLEEVITGKVTRLADFGAFVELEPGIEGLVPIGEMTYERRLKHPSEVLKAGDMVRAKIMSITPETKRISLSLKRVGADPWMGASARWPSGSIVQGVVKRIADFGAFVELTGGVEGLVHISELSGERVRAVSDVAREGQLVTVKVLEVDEEKHRISLSIKQAAGQTEEAAVQEEQAQPAPVRKRKKPLKGGLD
jgi:small subunit ribosomal protein S1